MAFSLSHPGRPILYLPTNPFTLSLKSIPQSQSRLTDARDVGLLEGPTAWQPATPASAMSTGGDTYAKLNKAGDGATQMRWGADHNAGAMPEVLAALIAENVRRCHLCPPVVG